MEIKRNELLIDLEGCRIEFNEKNIQKYVDELCDLIKMKKHGKLILWEDSHSTVKELRGGISACQFIKTSSIILHSFETDSSCFVDIFSCKKFDFEKVEKFSKDFFKAKSLKSRKIN
jgi:S-adenosylmethionine/arginine decarboxylase-like enzyme